LIKKFSKISVQVNVHNENTKMCSIGGKVEFIS